MEQLSQVHKRLPRITRHLLERVFQQADVKTIPVIVFQLQTLLDERTSNFVVTDTCQTRDRHHVETSGMAASHHGLIGKDGLANFTKNPLPCLSKIAATRYPSLSLHSRRACNAACESKRNH
jgi:hypothetical protein